MGHPDIANIPDVGGRWKLRLDGMTEEGELEAESLSGFVAKIAGVIPPFRLKLGMIEVIAGKGELISREGLPVRGGKQCHT